MPYQTWPLMLNFIFHFRKIFPVIFHWMSSSDYRVGGWEISIYSFAGKQRWAKVVLENPNAPAQHSYSEVLKCPYEFFQCFTELFNVCYGPRLKLPRNTPFRLKAATTLPTVRVCWNFLQSLSCKTSVAASLPAHPVVRTWHPMTTIFFLKLKGNLFERGR